MGQDLVGPGIRALMGAATARLRRERAISLGSNVALVAFPSTLAAASIGLFAPALALPDLVCILGLALPLLVATFAFFLPVEATTSRRLAGVWAGDEALFLIPDRGPLSSRLFPLADSRAEALARKTHPPPRKSGSRAAMTAAALFVPTAFLVVMQGSTLFRNLPENDQKRPRHTVSTDDADLLRRLRREVASDKLRMDSRLARAANQLASALTQGRDLSRDDAAAVNAELAAVDANRRRLASDLSPDPTLSVLATAIRNEDFEGAREAAEALESLARSEALTKEARESMSRTLRNAARQQAPDLASDLLAAAEAYSGDESAGSGKALDRALSKLEQESSAVRATQEVLARLIPRTGEAGESSPPSEPPSQRTSQPDLPQPTTAGPAIALSARESATAYELSILARYFAPSRK